MRVYANGGGIHFANDINLACSMKPANAEEYSTTPSANAESDYASCRNTSEKATTAIYLVFDQ